MQEFASRLATEGSIPIELQRKKPEDGTIEVIWAEHIWITGFLVGDLNAAIDLPESKISDLVKSGAFSSAIVKVSLSEKLLSPSVEQKLVPIEIQAISALDIPTIPETMITKPM